MYYDIWTWSSSFLSAPGLAWKACLKETELETCHGIYRYATENNKYMKIFDKESSCLMYFDANNLYEWAISQKLPVNEFKWKNMFKFNEKSIKNYDEDSDKGYILEVDVEYSKRLPHFHSNAPFLPKKWRLKNLISLFLIFMIKRSMLHIQELWQKYKVGINHGLILNKIHRVIQFNQEHGLNSILIKILN